MNKNKIFFLLAVSALLLVLTLQNSSALIIKSVDAPDVSPGEEAEIHIQIKNTLDKYIEGIIFSIDTRNLPFSLKRSSSEFFINELEDGEDTTVAFNIRVSSTAKPGDYNIPYTLTYQGLTQPRTGVITIRIKGSPEIEISSYAEKPVLDSEGKITLKIVNKGSVDARYVSLKFIPTGLFLSSEDNVYIGDIRANDFETVSFNVKYESLSPVIVALVEYRDFNNELKKLVFKDSIKVYTREEALKSGIIQKNNTLLYIIIALVLVIAFIVWRAIKKSIRRKRSLQQASL